MELFTKTTLPAIAHKITHNEAILLSGSCFAANMGDRLTQAKFKVCVNPSGVVYNPAAIHDYLRRTLSGTPYTESDLFVSDGQYHSFGHHSSFSSANRDEALQKMNASREQAFACLKEGTWLIVTFGTAYVYRLKSGNRIVANCHKQPDALFDRSRMSVEEITDLWIPLLKAIRAINPCIKFLFTVSPIRHRKDGLHENQLSKATLLLAAEKLEQCTEQSYYFPAYEIMNDELRDYRFYAEDMVHPSPLAIDYIWERFQTCLMDEATQAAIREWQPIRRAIEHLPFNPQSEAYRDFLSQTLLKIEEYRKEFPYFDVDKERAVIEARLSDR
jgi:Mor family transcriptional regulator